MKSLVFKNSDQMPMLGLGTWKSKPGEVYAAVRQAIHTGYRHFDCAAIYGNEPEIGKALKDAMNAGDITRQEIWVTSKLWNNAHAKDQVQPALEKTLADLCLDYLDLYLIHWPVALKPGVIYPEKASELIALSDLPVSETWEGMEACVSKGLTRHIGVSNFSVKKLKALMDVAGIKPEMNQIELHPFLQQIDMLTYCRENHIFLTAYSPLGSADRAAHLKSREEKSLLGDPAIVKLARKKGCTPAQVLIRWAIERHTAVIPKTVNKDRLAENLKSMEIEWSAEDMDALLSLNINARYVRGAIWTLPHAPYTAENLWD